MIFYGKNLFFKPNDNKMQSSIWSALKYYPPQLKDSKSHPVVDPLPKPSKSFIKENLAFTTANCQDKSEKTVNTGTIIKNSFETTYKIYQELDGATICSMGMSRDFELAISCGSNMIRLGSVMFNK